MSATDPGDGGHCRDAAPDEPGGRRLKTLEDETAGLKPRLAQQMLDNAPLKDGVAKMVMPDANRNAAAHACTVHAVSQCRVYLALKIDRSTVRYTSKLLEKAEGS